MASLTLRGLNDRFPEGTSLGIYPRSNFGSSTPPVPGLAPLGSATNTQTVANDSATFTGLADDTAYVVTDSSGSKYLQTGTQVAHGGVPHTDSTGHIPWALMAGRAIKLQDAAYGADPTGVADSSPALLKAIGDIAGNGEIDLGKGTLLFNGATAVNGTGTTTNTSATVTGATGTWYKGQTITGTGIPANTVIYDVSGATLTLSQAATASGTVTLSARSIGIALPAGAAGIEIYGAGRKLTTVKLSSGTKRFLDLFTTADYQTSQNITIRDFTVDAASQTTSGNEHVILGNLVGGNYAQRANVSNIRIQRVDSINVTTSTAASGARHSVSIGSRHLAAAEGTVTSLTDILVEDCNFAGGNYGVAVIGSVASGTSCEVYHDRVTVRRVDWDSGLVASSHGSQINAGACVQIGGVGYGDASLIESCTGANSGDVTYEVDGMGNGRVVGCRGTNHYNGGVLFRNFHPPPNLATQRCIARECEMFHTSALDPSPSGAPAPHYQVGGDSATTNYVFGDAIFENCISRWNSALATLGPTAVAVGKGLSVYADNVQARSIQVRGMRIGGTNIAITNNDVQRFPTFIGIRNALAGGRVEVENVHFRFAGTRSGTTDNQWRMVALHGADVVLKVDNVTFDLAGLTGVGTANDTFYWVISNDQTSTIRGTIRGIRATTAPVASSRHNGVYIGSSATITISDKLIISGCDFGKVAGVGTGVLDYNITANQLPKVIVSDYVSTRSGTGAVDAAIASAATITLAPAGERFSVTGTTNITSVTASWAGRLVTLVFSGILTFTDGSNLQLAGNFVTTADDTITLRCDGTNWAEVSRSVN